MKKILFTTTALVAATLVAADAQAQTKKKAATKSVTSIESTRYLQDNDMMGPSAFKATVGGYADWYVGYADNDNAANVNEFDVMGDVEVHFDFEAKLKNGLKVGAHMELEAGTDTAGNAGQIDYTYMYAENKYGKVIVGRNESVNESMSVHATDVGSLDIQETDFTRFIINTNNKSSYLSTTYFTADADLTKISYISPKFSGFQIGATYAPADDKNDDDVVRNGYDATIVTATFESKVEQVGFAVSAGYGFNTLFGASNDIGNLSAYNVGGRLMFGGLSVAGAYKMVDTQHDGEYKVFDVGAVYEVGPYATSLSYIAGELDNGDTDSTLMLSGKYNMVSGVDFFATLGFGDYEAANNKGWALIAGTMLSF